MSAKSHQSEAARCYAEGRWAELWALLDSPAYARERARSDPSLRSYAADLDLGRRAAAERASDLETLVSEHLPRLWRYTLLRLSLHSWCDFVPGDALKALVYLGRLDEAMSIAERRTSQEQCAYGLSDIGFALLDLNRDDPLGVEFVLRAAQLTHNQHRRNIGTTLVEYGHLAVARAIAEPMMDIDCSEYHVILGAIIREQFARGDWDGAEATIQVEPVFRAQAMWWGIFAVALARAGEHARADQALETARSSSAPSRYGYTCEQIRRNAITVRLFQQRWDEARAELQLLDYEEHAAVEVAGALIDAGFHDEARALLAQVNSRHYDAEMLYLFTALRPGAADSVRDKFLNAFEGHSERLPMLSIAVPQLIGIGEFAVARQLIDLPEIESDTVLRAWLIGVLSFAQAQAGHAEQARARCVEIAELLAQCGESDSDGTFDCALEALANTLIHLGDWNGARAALARIQDVEAQIEGLGRLATALYQRGLHRQAQEAFAGAQRLANEISTSPLTYVLLPLAQAMIDAGLAEFAASTAWIIRDQYQPNRLPGEIVAILARAGAVEQADQLLTTIYAEARAQSQREPILGSGALYEHFQVYPQHRVAAQVSELAAAGRWEEAHQLIETLDEWYHRIEPLRMLALACAGAGRWEEARAAVERLRSQSDQLKTICEVGMLATQADLWHEAEHCKHQAQTYAEKFRTQSGGYLSQTFLLSPFALGWWEVALTLIDAADEPNDRATLLSALAVAYAEAGRQDLSDRAIAEALELLDDWTSLLAPAMAANLVLLGRHTEAEAIFSAALAAAEATPIAPMALRGRFFRLMRIVRELSRAGLSVRAEALFRAGQATAEGYANQDHRVATLSQLASHLRISEHYSHLRELCAEILLSAEDRDAVIEFAAGLLQFTHLRPQLPLALKEGVEWAEGMLREI